MKKLKNINKVLKNINNDLEKNIISSLWINLETMGLYTLPYQTKPNIKNQLHIWNYKPNIYNKTTRKEIKELIFMFDDLEPSYTF